MRKALQSQEGKEELQERIKLLEEEKDKLQNSITDMKIKAEQAERRNAELRASEEKKHAEEVAFLKKTNTQLKVISDRLNLDFYTSVFLATPRDPISSDT